MSRAPHALAAVAALAAPLTVAACVGESPAPVTARPPSVLLVVIDTLRADAVSAGGHAAGRDTTPQLALVAEAGVRFTDVTAPATWTWPSHASLFTGEPPWVHGAHYPPLAVDAAGQALAADTEGLFLPLREDLPTLAERLDAAGYDTASYSANCLLDPSLGLTRGFGSAHCDDQGSGVVDAAVAHLARPDERPLLLFVNLMPAHSPWHLAPVPWAQAHAEALAAPAAWLTPYVTPERPGVDLFQRATPEAPSGVMRYHAGDHFIPAGADGLGLLRDLYEGEVRAADHQLAKLVAAFTAAEPDGVVVVTSDHGEQLGEHGLLMHRTALWPEVTQVPLVVAAPGRLAPGLVVDTPVQLQDVMPTLLDLTGVQEHAPGSLRAIASGAPRPGVVAAMSWPVPARAAQLGGRFAQEWRLLREGDEALVLWGEHEAALFDLADDPGMTHDLAADRPERVAALRATALEQLVEPADQATRQATRLDPAQRAQLELLGYLEPTPATP